MNLIITYKNGENDVFEEKQLDCTSLTVRGHGSTLIATWSKGATGIYKIDNYNAVVLDEIMSVRVV